MSDMLPQWRIKRRSLLGALAGLPALGALKVAAQDGGSNHFAHGVASGDPLVDSVIIWTRVSDASDGILVNWQVARDPEMKKIVRRGKVESRAPRDHCVKVDVKGLRPGKTYYYRFQVGGELSPIGRTKTLPKGRVSKARFAVASCANYPYGFFNVYRHMAERDDLDAVLHLGDYIYEYPRGVYASEIIEQMGRVVNPEGELLALEDYRARYATYRLDADLQAVHAAHPFIAVWDDHETSNDSWHDGAENHNPDTGEGDWVARREAAKQAYMEWMPIREDMNGEKGEIYRAFDYGNLARLIMLDTRLSGRDKQLSYNADIEPEIEARNANPDAPPKPDIKGFIAKLRNPLRTILGAKQEAWLRDQLEASKTAGQTWQVLGQQVLSGNIPIPKNGKELLSKEPEFQADRIKAMFGLAPFGLPINLDAWDGYPAARQRLVRDIMTYAENAVVLAGDTHNAWAFELKDGDGIAAVEFGTPSVSSPGLEKYLPVDPEALREALIEASPELVWADTKRRGYITLTLTREAAQADFWFMDTVFERQFTATNDKTLVVKAKSGPGVSQLSAG